jgi:membrane fusion protein, multidrug efflux system
MNRPSDPLCETPSIRHRFTDLWMTAGLGTLLIVTVIGCSEPPAEEDAFAAVVEVETVTLGSLEESIRLTGNILAGRSVRVFGQVPDRLVEVLVEAGDAVRSGQAMARIRSDALTAAVEQTTAALRAASVTLANLEDEQARSRSLFEAGALSRQALESVESRVEATAAQVEQLEAALSQARVGLDNTRITAPFDGIVAARYLEAGDMAGPGVPVFQVADLRRMRVQAEVSQEQLGRIVEGLETRIMVSAFPGRVFPGRVDRISPVLNPLSRMATMEAVVPNSRGLLRPGMFAEVQVITRRVEQANLVPLAGLLEEYRFAAASADLVGTDRELEAQVYLLGEENRVRLHTIQVGLIGREQVEVRSGLKPGDRVVTIGKHLLYDGAEVRLHEERHDDQESVR